MNLISKDELLKTLGYYRDNNISDLTIDDNKLKLRQGNFEYVFNPDAINYTGSGEEFVTVSLADSGWTAQGIPTVVNGAATLDGSSYLTYGELALGGQDFQISGQVLESADDMIARRKIFELYASQDLNLSLYSSGAGKNLDMLVNVGGMFDNYNEPAILEREYHFVLKWKQDTGTLTLHIDGNLIYTVAGAGFTERKTFSQLILGSSTLHANANWKGTIADFKVYDGFAEN